MSKEIIVIIGPARAGKSTFANWMSLHFGGKNSGTSRVVYELMAKARGCTLEDLYAIPKEELRPHLIEFADSLCDIYPDILSKKLINDGYTIIDGVRRLQELKELRENYITTVYYVKRDHGTVDDNFNIPEQCAEFIVDNNGGLNEFKIRPNLL